MGSYLRISMSSEDSKQDQGYLWGFYDAMREKELRKLRITKCPDCKKSNVYRLSSLGEAKLHCKSCGAEIKVERYKSSSKPQ